MSATPGSAGFRLPARGRGFPGVAGRKAACADERGTVGSRTNVTRWVLSGETEVAGVEQARSLTGSVLP